MQALVVLPTLAQTGSGGGALLQLLPLLLIVAVFWLLVLRPQQRRARQHQALIASIGVGDRVVTIGGVHGTISGVDDETVRLEIAPGTVVTVTRRAIARTLVDADTGGG